MRIEISGIDRTEFYSWGTLEIEDEINARTEVSFEMVDTSGALDLVDGETVEIYDNSNNLIFGGFLFFPKRFNPIGTDAIFYKITCVDQQAIADRFLAAEAYEDKTAGFIVEDMITTYLTADGVTVGTIQAGPTLEKAVFPRQGTVASAFDELAEIAGFAWWIDSDKQAYFVERSTYAAPWALNDAHMPVRNINVREDKSRYRNRQYVRGGLDITQEIELEKPTPKPDGVSRSFVVRFPVAEKPRIFIDSVEVLADDIGVNGFDTGKKYYFTFNSNTITQDDSETILADTVSLEITYRGLFPMLVVSEDPAAITDRQAIEGGSGVYENIINEPKTNNRQVALDIANGKLRKFTKIERELEFETELTGLEAGQLLTVDLTKYQISGGEFLIDRVTITDYDGRGNFRYNVHAVDGEVFGGWTNFFKSMLTEGGKLFIREDEVLVVLSTSFETQNWTEATVTNVFACPIPFTEYVFVSPNMIIEHGLFPSEDLFPC